MSFSLQSGSRSDALTELTRRIFANDQSIPVLSTAPFQESGRIKIEGERIRYASKTPTSFEGCTRGVDLNEGGDPPRDHMGGVYVYQDQPTTTTLVHDAVALVMRSSLALYEGPGIAISLVDNPATERSELTISVTALLPTGSVIPFFGTTAPIGFLIGNGALVSRVTYAALFLVYGTTFGIGDGITTFGLPDMRGRVPVGFDVAQAEFNTLGKIGGAKTHTLIASEMPIHAHGATDLYSASFLNTTPTGPYPIYDNPVSRYAPTDNAGGGGAHNNLQPYMVWNWIIKI